MGRYGYFDRPESEGKLPDVGSSINTPASQLPRAVARASKDAPLLGMDEALRKVTLPPDEEVVVPEEDCVWTATDSDDFTLDGESVTEWAEDNGMAGCGTLVDEDFTGDAPLLVSGIRGQQSVQFTGIQYLEGIFRELCGSTGFTWNFVVRLDDLAARTATLFHAIGADATDVEMLLFQFVPGSGSRHKVVVTGRRDEGDDEETLESDDFILPGFHDVLFSWDIANANLLIMVDGAVAINEMFGTAGVLNCPFASEFMFMAVGARYDLDDAYAIVDNIEGMVGAIHTWGAPLTVEQGQVAHLDRLEEWPLQAGSPLSFDGDGFATFDGNAVLYVTEAVTVDILEVGGGQGGFYSGKGGAGAEVTVVEGVVLVAGQVITVSIGRGGQRGLHDGDVDPGDGGDTTVVIGVTTYTAESGGTHVGGSYGSTVSGDGAVAYGGGPGTESDGEDGVDATGGAGGDGLTLTGWPISRPAAGGGGGARCDADRGTPAGGQGGDDGGGVGGTTLILPGENSVVDGLAATGPGSGGGGGGSAESNGGDGADGLVSIRIAA